MHSNKHTLQQESLDIAYFVYNDAACGIASNYFIRGTYNGFQSTMLVIQSSQLGCLLSSSIYCLTTKMELTTPSP